MISVKRAYDDAAAKDGERFLVDQLWPRGLKKESVKIKEWIKAVAPSAGLRKWFGHDSEKWKEFQQRYFAELDEKPDSWKSLLEAAREGDVMLVYGARDTEHNNAVALKSYLEKKVKKAS